MPSASRWAWPSSTSSGSTSARTEAQTIGVPHEFSALHEKLNQYINKGRLKSPWVVHYDCGSCNGCDIEVLACLTPVFDVERFGIVNIGDPKHADVLLVTGTVNQRNKDVLKNLYDQMPEPKAVIAIGACACTGGVFQDCYNVVGGVGPCDPRGRLRARLRGQARSHHRWRCARS